WLPWSAFWVLITPLGVFTAFVSYTFEIGGLPYAPSMPGTSAESGGCWLRASGFFNLSWAIFIPCLVRGAGSLVVLNGRCGACHPQEQLEEPAHRARQLLRRVWQRAAELSSTCLSYLSP